MTGFAGMAGLLLEVADGAAGGEDVCAAKMCIPAKATRENGSMLRAAFENDNFISGSPRKNPVKAITARGIPGHREGTSN